MGMGNGDVPCIAAAHRKGRDGRKVWVRVLVGLWVLWAVVVECGIMLVGAGSWEEKRREQEIRGEYNKNNQCNNIVYSPPCWYWYNYSIIALSNKLDAVQPYNHHPSPSQYHHSLPRLPRLPTLPTPPLHLPAVYLPSTAPTRTLTLALTKAHSTTTSPPL